MTDLAITSPTLAYAPTNFKELMQFAEVMSRSRAVPECYRNDPAAVIFAVQMGAEIGLGPGQSIQSIANIEGSLRMWGDTPLAIIQASGKLEWIKETSNFPDSADPKEQEALYKTWWARCEMKRVGVDEPFVTEYTYLDAVRAGLWGRTSNTGKAMPWKSSPKRLMKYRARGFTSRDGFSDVLKGIAIREEFGDVHGERNVTPDNAAKPTPTGNDALRETLAGAMGASGVAKVEPPPQPVDDGCPDFDVMLVAQVSETLDGAGHDAGLTVNQYHELARATLDGRRLTKSTAPEVWRAIQAWEPPAVPADVEEPTLL